MQKKLGPLANGEFGQPAAAATSLLRDQNVGTVAWYRAVLAGAADRLEQLERGVAEIQRLSQKIDQLGGQNLPDSEKLALARQYGFQIREGCRRLLP